MQGFQARFSSSRAELLTGKRVFAGRRGCKDGMAGFTDFRDNKRTRRERKRSEFSSKFFCRGKGKAALAVEALAQAAIFGTALASDYSGGDELAGFPSS